MNWLGAGIVAFVAALLGAVLGAIVQFELHRHGIDAPPVVGIVAGLAAALASREKSGLRGVLVASLAVWASAVAEVVGAPARGLIPDLAFFHERLGFTAGLGYVACAVVAAVLASRARPRKSSIFVLAGARAEAVEEQLPRV